jgi:alkylation response protein AidB-like acyl-CoA dehydrogenase
MSDPSLSLLSSRIAFSDEQAMLLDSAVAFCRERSPSLTVRALLASETGFDRGLWSEIAQLGWNGIAVPERFGGSGLTLGHTALIAEPMGRHLLATPFTSTQLCIQGLLAGGSESQQAAWLPRLADGGIGSVALFEDDGDWDLTRPQARATRSDAHVTLQGAKTLVTDGAVADLLLVSVLLDDAPALAMLPTAGLAAGTLQRETLIDETRRSHRLTLDGVTLPAEALITGRAALAALRAIHQAALLLASAEAAGGIAGVLDVVVDYLNTRTTFGRKIGSYQGLKHPAADMLVGLERARSHVAHAATLLAGAANADEDAEIALRMAKAEACDSLVFAGDRAVQFHGGFGFTYDCDAQLYLRRALWLQPWFGDAAHQRQQLADALWPLAAAA